MKRRRFTFRLPSELDRQICSYAQLHSISMSAAMNKLIGEAGVIMQRPGWVDPFSDARPISRAESCRRLLQIALAEKYRVS